MASKLAQMRKHGLCICSKTGVLSATLVNQDDKRFVRVLLCDQHNDKPIADRALAAIASTGLPMEVSEGKAKEPVDE